MAKTARNPAAKYIENLKSIIFIATLIFIFYPPYVRGLYFEDEQLIAEIFVFILFIGFYILNHLEKHKTFLKTPLDYASVGFLIIYIIPLIAYFFHLGGSVAPRSSLLEWLKYFMYFSVFIMLSNLLDTIKKIKIFWIILTSTVGLCIIGFDGATGSHLTNILNNIFSFLGLNISFFDTFLKGRMHSTLQYPNAFAAYLAAVFFISIALIILSSKTSLKVISGASSFIILNALFYTHSRGAQLLFPIIFLVFILILPKVKRLEAIVNSVLLSTTFVAVSILGLLKFMSSPLENSYKVWLFLILGCLVSGFFTLYSQKISYILRSFTLKYYILGSIPLVIVVIILLFIITSTAPLQLLSNSSMQKEIALNPNIPYKLSFEVDSNSSYKIKISSKALKDIIVSKAETLIYEFDGAKTIGKSKREIKFNLPKDSKTTVLYFITSNKGSKATFSNVVLYDQKINKPVKSIALNYKYLPYSVASKFENIFLSRSSVERSIFYKDALNMAKDRWLIGSGGGSWAYLYFSYQSFMYWSTQAHNYILQIFIECGILGILVLLSFILCILYSFIKLIKKDLSIEKKVLISTSFSGILVLMIHSAMDFDLSLSSVYLLLWELVAVINSEYSIEESFKFKKLKIHPIVNIIVIIILIFFPVSFKIAKGYANKAINYSKIDLNSSIEYMESAIDSDPMMPQYRLDYMRLLKNLNTDSAFQKIVSQLDITKNLSYYSADLMSKLGIYYLYSGKIDEGLDAFDRATQLRPLRVEEWQQKLNAYYSVVIYYDNKNDFITSKKYIDRALLSIDQAKNYNRKNMNPFKFNGETDEIIEKFLQIKENPEIDFDKVIFNGIYNMDINMDGFMDQFNKNNNISTLFQDNSIIFSSTKDGDFIQSRTLKLLPAKSYDVIIVPKENTFPTSFEITGQNIHTSNIVQDGSIYKITFKTDNKFKPNANTFRLYFNNKLVLNSLKIFEK